MKLVNIADEGAKYKWQLYDLYDKAFPEQEKKPLQVMENLVADGKMEMLAMVDEDEFVGLAINLIDAEQDRALLDYYAIAPEKRNYGYGSKGLEALLKKFKNHKYIFEIETQDEKAENAEERKKRKAFFTGMILGGILIFFLTGRIWNIHIEGNVRNSTGEILDFLDKQDINHGMSKKKINCSEVAAAVRKNFPEITWVSARIEGTRLILNIQEGIIPQKTNSNTSPCNLLADKDGVITDMIVRRGIPVKKPGDSCKKGELLVSGELHIMNDSQEVLRKEYVHADADIFISRQISYYQEFPLKYRTEIPAGKKKKEMYFRFGHWYLGLYPALHTGQKRITEEIPLRITENFILPVWIGWTETTDYTVKEETYTRKEAEKEAVRRFHQYEKKLLQNGIKISENHITTRLTESLCITGGTLLIIEQTGEKSRIT